MFNRIPFNHNTHISHIYTHQNGSNLWVGDQQAARDIILLNRLDITAVLTAADGLNIAYTNSNINNNSKNSNENKINTLKSKNIQHLVIRAHDMPSYNIRQHFAQSNKFIIQNLSKGNHVLVHCAAGISRSIALILAFLIRKLNFNLKNAMNLVQNRRSVANPNYGFIQQLKLYQQQIQYKKGHNSLRNYTQSYTNKPINQINILINQRKIQQKQKMKYAFQDKMSSNKRSVDSVLSKYSARRYLIKEAERQVSVYQRQKSMSMSKSKQKQKQKQKQMVKMNQRNIKLEKLPKNQIRKRIDTQNTVLFPKIVLIKKLQKIQNQKANLK